MGDTRRRRLAVIALLAVAAFPAGGCAKRAMGRFLLHPVPPAEEHYSLAAGAAVYSDGKVEVEARPLDLRFVERCLTEAGRPNFLAVPEGAPAPLVFEVRVRAAGKGVVWFNAQQARAFDEGKRRYFPLGYTDFYSLHQEDPDAPALLRAFTDLCFDAPVQIKPGQEVRRYLPLGVYQEVPEQLTLHLPLHYGGKEGIYPVFLFEGFPAEKDEPRP